MIDFNHYLGSQIGYQLLQNAEEQALFNLIHALQPKLTQDGNQWCYLYGELPNNCIVGFGETPEKAMRDFCNNFHTQKIIKS